MRLRKTDTPFASDGNDALTVLRWVMQHASGSLVRKLASLGINQHCPADMLHRHLRQYHLHSVFFLNGHRVSAPDIVELGESGWHGHPIFERDGLHWDAFQLTALWAIIEEGSLTEGEGRTDFERAKLNWQTAFSTMGSHGGTW